MVMSASRRDFLKTSLIGGGLGLLGPAALTGCATRVKGDFAPKSGQRVIVIGGGWGGATAAKYIRLLDPKIEVLLIEPNREFVSCPFSNLVLSGVRKIDSLTFTYAGLRRNGVRIIHETAAAIEPDRKRVRVGEGYLEYDRLVVSPGVEFQWEQVEGLAQSQDKVLHAWKAGPQTVALAQQLHSISDGGVFVLSVPPVAYRCPPGPYERVCQVAWYLKHHKPKSKLIVLDANQNIVSKTALFRAAWQAYPNIEYRASSKVVGVDPSVKEVRTEFDRVRYDVINLIPPQRAGKIAAIAIVHQLNGKEAPAMAPGNTCYSWVNDREAIAVVNAYKIENGKVVQIEQKLTPSQSEAWGQHAVGWAQSLWNDMLA